MLTLAEAQELHQLIGLAMTALEYEVLAPSDLDRALELAALLVSDLLEEEG